MSKESYLIPRRSFLRGVGAALALPSLGNHVTLR